MKLSIPFLLLPLLTSTTNALYLCLFNGEISYSGGYSSYPEPDCLVQHGTDSDDCSSRANNGALIGIKCSEAITQHTNQGAGFWIENGDINYESGGTHWYCTPGPCGGGGGIGVSCGCDAGNGNPS